MYVCVCMCVFFHVSARVIISYWTRRFFPGSNSARAFLAALFLVSNCLPLGCCFCRMYSHSLGWVLYKWEQKKRCCLLHRYRKIVYFITWTIFKMSIIYIVVTQLCVTSLIEQYKITFCSIKKKKLLRIRRARKAKNSLQSRMCVDKINTVTFAWKWVLE